MWISKAIAFHFRLCILLCVPCKLSKLLSNVWRLVKWRLPSLFGHGQGRDRHQSAVLDVIMARMDYGLATPGVTSDAAFNS